MKEDRQGEEERKKGEREERKERKKTLPQLRELVSYSRNSYKKLFNF